MPFKWTEGSLRDANIVDEDEFNREYNNYKGVINGGLDRDNLPAASIGQSHLKAGAFLEYNLSSDDVMVQDLTTSQTMLTFNDALSGWIHNTDQKLSVTTQEGMLHIEFCCWYTLRQDSPDTTGTTRNNQRWVQAGLLINNNFVAKTSRIYSYAGNVNMSVAVPVASGPQQVHVAFRGSVPPGGGSLGLTNFQYNGGQLLLINRYR